MPDQNLPSHLSYFFPPHPSTPNKGHQHILQDLLPRYYKKTYWVPSLLYKSKPSCLLQPHLTSLSASPVSVSQPSLLWNTAILCFLKVKLHNASHTPDWKMGSHFMCNNILSLYNDLHVPASSGYLILTTFPLHTIFHSVTCPFNQADIYSELSIPSWFAPGI